MGLWQSSRNHTKPICSRSPPGQEDRWSSSEGGGWKQTTRLRYLKGGRGRAAWSWGAKSLHRRTQESFGELGIRRRARSLCPGNGIEMAVYPSVLFGKAKSFHLGNRLRHISAGNGSNSGQGVDAPHPFHAAPYNSVERSIPSDPKRPTSHSKPTPEPPTKIWLQTSSGPNFTCTTNSQVFLALDFKPC